MFENTVTLRSGIRVGQEKVGNYFVDFFRGGPKLIVVFETADVKIERSDALRMPWHMPLLRVLGYSVLAIKPRRIDWYRGRTFRQWFGSAEMKSFLASFGDVIFYGGSMGGFGALTFSRVVPGSLVVVFSPQSTLNRELVPWEGRHESRAFDWSGSFRDAADAAPLARRIYVFYDPLHHIDKRHVARFDGPNVVHMKTPFLGHNIPRWLMDLGLIKDALHGAFFETLTTESFAKMIRRRRDLPRYYAIAEWYLQKHKRGRFVKVVRKAKPVPSPAPTGLSAPISA